MVSLNAFPCRQNELLWQQLQTLREKHEKQQRLVVHVSLQDMSRLFFALKRVRLRLLADAICYS